MRLFHYRPRSTRLPFVVVTFTILFLLYVFPGGGDDDDSDDDSDAADNSLPRGQLIARQQHEHNDLELELEQFELSESDNLYELSPRRQQLFFLQRERVYEQRRRHLAKYCDVVRRLYNPGGKNRLMSLSPHTLLYDAEHNVAHCSIAKVASSTWCRHFITLAGHPEQAERSKVPQVTVKGYFPLPRDIDQLMKDALSLAIVRNPLSRLVSVYHAKVLHMSYGEKFINRVVNSTRSEERKKMERVDSYQFQGDDPAFPSPSEFCEYIAHNLESAGGDIDFHWRPIHGSCPFCRFDFSVLSKMEELNEDTAYFLLKANLTSLIKANLHSNISKTRGSGQERDREFLSRVPGRLIRRLYQLYYLDFQMFGYDLEEYLVGLGLEHKLLED